jgi:hypothetical protein
LTPDVNGISSFQNPKPKTQNPPIASPLALLYDWSELDYTGNEVNRSWIFPHNSSGRRR